MCLIQFNWSLEIVSVFSNFLALLNMRKTLMAISLADNSVKRGGGDENFIREIDPYLG